MAAVRNPAHAGRQQAAGGGRGRRGPAPARPRFWYIVAGVAISAVFVLPLAWEVLRSFQPESAISSAPSAQQLRPPDLRANYKTLLSGQDDILRNVINSLIVAVLSASADLGAGHCWPATASRCSASAARALPSAWCCWPS